MADPIEVYGRAADLVAAGPSDEAEVLAALAGVPAVRADLDRVERDLIAAARALGVGWPAIARALGLGSRQAAEQRWLRLRGGLSRDPNRVRATQRGQRIVDAISGQPVVELRRAAVELHRRIEADHGWGGRHSRAPLARASLAAAVDAPPGALYALCRHVVDDLGQIPLASLPPPLAAATRRLMSAERRARPSG